MLFFHSIRILSSTYVITRESTTLFEAICGSNVAEKTIHKKHALAPGHAVFHKQFAGFALNYLIDVCCVLVKLK